MKTLTIQDLKTYSAVTHNGASAYDYSKSHPLIHLTFTMGSALFTDGYYQTEQHQVRNFARALIDAWRTEQRFPWQYAAWMRDPRGGKGNRIQGSLAPALLDATFDETAYTSEYIAKCLSHRPDDVIAFVNHYKQLGLGQPSDAAKQGMARALCQFDEYQLMKYARQRADLRLCDAIGMVRPILEEMGDEAQLVLRVHNYLRAPSRARKDHLEHLPLTRTRRALWQKEKSYATSEAFADHVRQARVTWEQVFGHFGTNLERTPGVLLADHQRQNAGVWRALLAVPGLLPDMAFLRNLQNMHLAGLSFDELCDCANTRRFAKIWPHQIYAAHKAHPQLAPVLESIMSKLTAVLPTGRHLGLGDASGSMNIKIGGPMGTITARDVAFCFVGLMGLTSDLGASFADASWFSSYHGYQYLSIKQRKPQEGALAFCNRRGLRSGMGGTQVFGAVLELVDWLMQNPDVEPPECLWFFSDMQFDPASHASGKDNLPEHLMETARQKGIDTAKPPMEVALALYREIIGPVDVVLWNLAAYTPVPVPSDMEGVLLVSGFDTNTFKHVEAWRQNKCEIFNTVEDNQEVILNTIRSY